MFRIVPLYWLGTFGVFLVALAMPALLNATTANLTNLSKSLFLIPYRREDGATFPMLFLGWTLEYEMFFYFVFGLSLMFFKRWASLAASLLLAAVAAAGAVFQPSSTIPRFYSNPIILEFVLGMAVFAVWHRYRSWFNKFPIAAALAIAVGCYTYLYLVESMWAAIAGSFSRGFPRSRSWCACLPWKAEFNFPGGSCS